MLWNNYKVDQSYLPQSDLLREKKTTKKQCTLVDYFGEDFFVNLLPLKCNDTGRKKLDACMYLKLIEYGISDSRDLGMQPPDSVTLLTY